MTDTISPHERRAQAIAEISKLQDDFVGARDRIAQLEAQLRDQETVMQREINRQEARAEVAERDRATYRAEAHLFRTKLVEMVTTISNVRKMTDEAEKIAGTVNSILHGETPEEAAAEQASAQNLVESISAAASRGKHIDLDKLEEELFAPTTEHASSGSGN